MACSVMFLWFGEESVEDSCTCVLAKYCNNAAKQITVYISTTNVLPVVILYRS